MRNRSISQKQVSTNIAAWKMDHEWRCTVFPMGNYVFFPPSHLTVGNTAICWGHVSSRHGVLLFGDGLFTFYHGIHPHFASPAWGNGSLIDVTGTAVEEEAAPIFLASAVFKMSGFILCKTRWWFQKCFNVFSIWAWYATCWLIFLNWVVQPPPRKLVGWYHQRK